MSYETQENSEFVVGAADAACGCDNHTSNRQQKCHCCIFCDNLDTHYLTSCASKADGTLESPLDLCCSECKGVFPCFFRNKGILGKCNLVSIRVENAINNIIL